MPVLCAAALAVPVWAAPGLADDGAAVVVADPDGLPAPDPGALRPDLSLEVDGPADGVAGGEGLYTATVRNAASATGAARGFTVRWQALPGQSVLSVGSPGDDWACALSSEASCTWGGELAPGASAPPVSVRLGHSRRATGTLTSEVRVSGADGEVHLADNVARSRTAMVRPTLRVDVGAPATAAPGAAVRMVLSVTNAGPGWASGFSVVGAVPEGLRVETLSGAGFDCDTALRACTYTDELGPGLSAAVTLTGSLSPTLAAGPLTTTARLGDGGPTASAVTTVEAPAPVVQPPVQPQPPVRQPQAQPQRGTVAPVRTSTVRRPAVSAAARRTTAAVRSAVLPPTQPAPQTPATPPSGSRPETLPFAVPEAVPSAAPETLPFTAPGTRAVAGSREDTLLVTGVALLMAAVAAGLTVRRRRTAGPL